ncbi:aliphatic sulfonate ABC transporter substrate-binding protein [Rhizobium leguminosarum]|jgi:sulfonate transport system substrate-binding protein|uniref:aliphatic sulfonate ABC transporter substrate-binding protein n=1 Tax=Rhizobium leguminosarum TaxID=384 RepID=UPI000FEC98DA|nr:aliphatic sulfonate ABC transporter substrate-binding protein [Rhizobium leguminosarum]MBY2905977.1 aliphatic sulfonate ABC transporter substrate-binding protein [Rhizobium leguminosarum]MBY2921550.1 aliphatic sulfonate ABC transporter substrate-binding protein [Rhizobium leguminosarum]MBY2961841.1 aliphatic sulfonate ABC transporter substrate-binding protein [Rhizobium leguminosarum]MBY2989886.1 aliphatic sulfonate ABC transporter substrate-binding protein [Rhizobium leguminosarum]MBY29975
MGVFRSAIIGAAVALGLGLSSAEAADLSEIRIDWATYNPVSVLLKKEGLLEKEFAKDNISIRWVQSAGSNKALEFLNAGSIDFGSTAGAAALIARVNGNPIKSIYVYSRPEWTALVTRADSPISTVQDLKGKTIAVTRGTDPHVFLVRALADAGLKQSDVKLVLLQHADGKLALLRGDVDAWAGLDPLMAAAEVDDKAKLFYRKPENNSWGVLNTTETFAADHPDIIKRVIAVYEQARAEALADPAALKAALVEAAKLPDDVIAKQLERTDISQSTIGDLQRDTISKAGIALQSAGVLPADVDIPKVTNELIDDRFAVGKTQ